MKAEWFREEIMEQILGFKNKRKTFSWQGDAINNIKIYKEMSCFFVTFVVINDSLNVLETNYIGGMLSES